MRLVLASKIFASRSWIKNLLKSSVFAGKLFELEISHWLSIFSITDFPFWFENSMYAIWGKISSKLGNNNSDDELNKGIIQYGRKKGLLKKGYNYTKNKTKNGL